MILPPTRLLEEMRTRIVANDLENIPLGLLWLGLRSWRQVRQTRVGARQPYRVRDYLLLGALGIL